jgi:hypothetical protein
MTKLVPEAIWRQILKPNSSAASDWKPAPTLIGGHGDSGGNVDLAAAGDLKCQTCPRGGSHGTTGMYEIDGKVLCANCAVKELGAQDLPVDQKVRILTPSLLGGQ